jgi:hypothetical protein
LRLKRQKKKEQKRGKKEIPEFVQRNGLRQCIWKTANGALQVG